MAFGKTLKGNKAMRLSAPGRRSSYNTLDSREKTENDVKKSKAPAAFEVTDSSSC